MTDDDNDQLDRYVKILMADLMNLLYQYDITQVHVGALMRLIGVDEETAAEHDHERIELTEDFAKYVQDLNTPRPANQTLH